VALSDRLDRLRREAGVTAVKAGALVVAPAAPPASSAQSYDLRERLQQLGRSTNARIPQSKPVREDAARLLGGKWVAEHVVLCEQRLQLSTRHGRHALSEARHSLWPLSDVQGRIVGIDTETTGLAGGTGTVAFMVGIAEMNGDAMHLRQWVLTAFAGESALLQSVAEALDGADLLVSYNGASYDLPLLRDRWRLALRAPMPDWPHIDWLHATRALFQSRWHNCRLETAEQQLLGLEREDDLPGAQAPAAWNLFLRVGQAGDLLRVVRHNALDVISLLLLGPVLASSMTAPQRHGADALAAARRWLQLGDRDRALAILEAAGPALDARGQRELARGLWSAGRVDAAVAIWESLVAKGDTHAAERLAIFHEHTRRDATRAMQHVAELPSNPAIEHRRSRLSRQLASPQLRLDLD
jgi:uncharacterized protein YprB with RNaseH-like and TPR domain